MNRLTLALALLWVSPSVAAELPVKRSFHAAPVAASIDVPDAVLAASQGRPLVRRVEVPEAATHVLLRSDRALGAPDVPIYGAAHFVADDGETRPMFSLDYVRPPRRGEEQTEAPDWRAIGLERDPEDPRIWRPTDGRALSQSNQMRIRGRGDRPDDLRLLVVLPGGGDRSSKVLQVTGEGDAWTSRPQDFRNQEVSPGWHVVASDPSVELSQVEMRWRGAVLGVASEQSGWLFFGTPSVSQFPGRPPRDIGGSRGARDDPGQLPASIPWATLGPAALTGPRAPGLEWASGSACQPTGPTLVWWPQRAFEEADDEGRRLVALQSSSSLRVGRLPPAGVLGGRWAMEQSDPPAWSIAGSLDELVPEASRGLRCVGEWAGPLPEGTRNLTGGGWTFVRGGPGWLVIDRVAARVFAAEDAGFGAWTDRLVQRLVEPEAELNAIASGGCEPRPALGPLKRGLLDWGPDLRVELEGRDGGVEFTVLPGRGRPDPVQGQLPMALLEDLDESLRDPRCGLSAARRQAISHVSGGFRAALQPVDGPTVQVATAYGRSSASFRVIWGLSSGVVDAPVPSHALGALQRHLVEALPPADPGVQHGRVHGRRRGEAPNGANPSRRLWPLHGGDEARLPDALAELAQRAQRVLHVSEGSQAVVRLGARSSSAAAAFAPDGTPIPVTIMTVSGGAGGSWAQLGDTPGDAWLLVGSYDRRKYPIESKRVLDRDRPPARGEPVAYWSPSRAPADGVRPAPPPGCSASDIRADLIDSASLVTSDTGRRSTVQQTPEGLTVQVTGGPAERHGIRAGLNASGTLEPAVWSAAVEDIVASLRCGKPRPPLAMSGARVAAALGQWSLVDHTVGPFAVNALDGAWLPLLDDAPLRRVRELFEPWNSELDAMLAEAPEACPVDVPPNPRVLHLGSAGAMHAFRAQRDGTWRFAGEQVEWREGTHEVGSVEAFASARLSAAVKTAGQRSQCLPLDQWTEVALWPEGPTLSLALGEDPAFVIDLWAPGPVPRGRPGPGVVATVRTRNGLGFLPPDEAASLYEVASEYAVKARTGWTFLSVDPRARF